LFAVDNFESALAGLQERLGYRFSNSDLLKTAVTHPSFLQDNPETPDSNQRLEFLGDAVLQLILTESLFLLFPQDREGSLSKRRSTLSKGRYLSGMAARLGIAPCLRISLSEEQCGGRERQSTLEDAFEALIGALYIDSDFSTAKRIVLALYGSLETRLQESQPAENPKGQLQERVQPEHGNHALRYAVTHVSGQDHAREYEAQLFLNETLIGKGRGSSKKSAEENAARQGLVFLENAEAEKRRNS
jgi:ribonuclease-3